MFAEALEDVVALSLGDFAFHFRKREMHDIVMVNLLVRQLGTQFEPYPVKQVYFLGRETGSVRTEIEDLFLA